MRASSASRASSLTSGAAFAAATACVFLSAAVDLTMGSSLPVDRAPEVRLRVGLLGSKDFRASTELVGFCIPLAFTNLGMTPFRTCVRSFCVETGALPVPARTRRGGVEFLRIATRADFFGLREDLCDLEECIGSFMGPAAEKDRC